jgi:sec-independent protein translocase protein TatB
MFDIDAGKILVVGVVALLVIGPKDLPRVLRTVGQTVGKMRRMAAEFQNQFAEAIKEADLEDVKKEFSAIRDSANIDTSFDAASLMRDEITSAVEGPKDIGQSTVDLTAIEPAKEIAATPTDGAPEQLSLALPETSEAAKDAEVATLDVTAAGTMTEATVHADALEPELPLPAPAEPPAVSKLAEAEPRQEHAEAPHRDEASERADAVPQGGH